MFSIDPYSDEEEAEWVLLDGVIALEASMRAAMSEADEDSITREVRDFHRTIVAMIAARRVANTEVMESFFGGVLGLPDSDQLLDSTEFAALDPECQRVAVFVFGEKFRCSDGSVSTAPCRPT
jgi:hypothetical protein